MITVLFFLFINQRIDFAMHKNDPTRLTVVFI